MPRANIYALYTCKTYMQFYLQRNEAITLIGIVNKETVQFFFLFGCLCFQEAAPLPFCIVNVGLHPDFIHVSA